MAEKFKLRRRVVRNEINPSLRCIFRNSRRIFKPSREEKVEILLLPQREPQKGEEVPKDIGTFFKRSSFSLPLFLPLPLPLREFRRFVDANDSWRTKRKRQRNLTQAGLFRHFCQTQIITLLSHRILVYTEMKVIRGYRISVRK